MDWTATIRTLAPTAASALLGPLGGAAIAAIGGILGIDQPTQATIEKAITSSQLTADQAAELRKLEMQYQNDEKERGFKYVELEFKDRADARSANVQGGTQKPLFWLSLVLLIVTLGSEVAVLFNGYPHTVAEIVVGRVLGLLDAVAMMVLSYWYGTSHGSQQKTDLLAQADAIK